MMIKMKIDIISVVPKLLESFLFESIIKRGIDKSLVEISVHDLREWALDKHKTVDDTPYGGGAGMVMKIDPLVLAINDLKSRVAIIKKEDNDDVIIKTSVILTSPRGRVYNQSITKELLNNYNHLIIICGHYKGVDERIYNYIDDEISIGDFILTGGEIPAAVITDSIVRLIPGVISDIASANSDSFSSEENSNLLDCGYYTRPVEFEGHKVPEVLTNGNHKLIENWKKENSLEKTKLSRPDLLSNK